MSGDSGSAEDIRVREDQVAGRFEILVDDVVAGFADYQDAPGTGTAPGVRTFPHTVVATEFGGRGLAGRMIGEALQQTRDKGLRVNPTCSFVARYIEKHPDSADLA
ncbi:GNAT family N-acetyltransferase [Dietzia aurantiaca]|uniref:GNAT family N-acetyltransferase n=1 Tax=Dietzia aurantiaca TaxID=983873 RepID=A0ABV9PVT1_9ACTN